MPFNSNDELTMRFTVTEWNEIIAQLQEGPYKKSAPLINKINLQAAQHERQARQAEADAQHDQETMAAQQPRQAGDITYTNGELLEAQPDWQQGQ